MKTPQLFPDFPWPCQEISGDCFTTDKYVIQPSPPPHTQTVFHPLPFTYDHVYT